MEPNTDILLLFQRQYGKRRKSKNNRKFCKNDTFITTEFSVQKSVDLALELGLLLPCILYLCVGR